MDAGRQVLADQAQRLDTADLELAQQAKELVRVLHAEPGRAQARNVDTDLGDAGGKE